jgi:hypothetical protein
MEEKMENGKFKTVVFLDIDGVLQPLSSQKRFEHNLDELKKELVIKYQNDEYLDMDKYDLGAVYYDWDKKAVERLRELCDKTDAKIVISSNWRSYSPLSRLKDYFRLHNLDTYIVAEIPDLGGRSRANEVNQYLENNQNVQKFVILDDSYILDFEDKYPKQFVCCKYIFDNDCYKKALGILQDSEKRL